MKAPSWVLLPPKPFVAKTVRPKAPVTVQDVLGIEDMALESPSRIPSKSRRALSPVRDVSRANSRTSKVASPSRAVSPSRQIPSRVRPVSPSRQSYETRALLRRIVGDRDVERMMKDDLIDILREAGLSTQGNKLALIHRITMNM